MDRWALPLLLFVNHASNTHVEGDQTLEKYDEGFTSSASLQAPRWVLSILQKGAKLQMYAEP